MNGHEYFFGLQNPTGWWISEKFDGVRALWNKSEFISKNGNVEKIIKWNSLFFLFFSNEFSFSFLGNILPVPISFKKQLPPTLLDGELW